MLKNARMKFSVRPLLLIAGVMFGWSESESFAQVNSRQINGGNLNTITTAVPFLMIAPDSRAGGMGDVGVATTVDANSIHWNPAKLAFAEKDLGLSISYTPWLRKLVPDISLAYLSGYKRLKNKRSAFGGSLRYFSLGNIQFTNEFGDETTQFRPNEFAVEGAYATKLSDKVSVGIAARYINSNLSGNANVGGADSRPGQTGAADVSFYYEEDEIEIQGRELIVAAGVNISNIGAKISYTETTKRDFLPINLRIGPRVSYKLDDYNTISFTVDFNKLMVPTPPIYAVDSSGSGLFDANGDPVLWAGQDPDRPVAVGMFGSFSDAPGDPVRDENGDFVFNNNGELEIESGSVFSEELREFTIATGLEYWYDDQFSVRAGYFWEHQLKGNRKYITLGAGLRYNVFGLDFAYLIPAYFGSNTIQQSPLENTLRFTLTFNFDNIKGSGSSGGDNDAVPGS